MAAGPAMVNRVYCLVYKQSGKPFSLLMMAGERWYFSCSHKKSTQKNGHKGALPLMDPPGHSGACCYRPARGNFVVSARCPAGLPRPGLVLEIPCPSCKGAWPGDIWWFVRRGGLWPPAAPVPRPPSPEGSVQKGGPQPPFGLVVLRGSSILYHPARAQRQRVGWGEETQRNERHLPARAGGGIWSLCRRCHASPMCDGK